MNDRPGGPADAYLQEMRSTLDRIARELRVVAGDPALVKTKKGFAEVARERHELLAAARNLALIRRQCGQTFGEYRDLFGDPAFDMLLAIYIAFEGDKTTTSVSSACYASGAPMTTGLRYVDKLVKRGLVSRHEDPFDRRRHLLMLTDSGTELIEACLRQFELAIEHRGVPRSSAAA